MKRPVTAILLALFIVATALWRGVGPVPIFGRVAEVPGPSVVLQGAADVLTGMPPTGAAWLRASDGGIYRWTAQGGRARPVAVKAMAVDLPGGLPITLERRTVSGRPRLMGILGAPSWIAPGGLAAVVYDAADSALWAVHADALKPLSLGAADENALDGVVWGPSGTEVAYLSGDPPKLWVWRVGQYATDLGMADGVPLAVRPDGAIMMSVGDRLSVEWPRQGRPLLVSSARPLMAAADGGAALCASAGRLRWVDGLNGHSVPLGVASADLVAAAFGPDDRVAVLAGGPRPSLVVAGGGRPRTVTSLGRGLSLPDEGASLAWVGAGRLMAVLDGPDGNATYLISLPQPAVAVL